jgi:hypothetical protein
MNYTLIMLIVWCPLVISSEQSKASVPLPSGGSVHFTINVNNTQDAKTNNSTHLISSQIEKRTNDSSLLEKLINPAAELSASLKKQIQQKTTNFFCTYKWYLLGGTILASYAALIYYLFQGNSYLGKSDLWSSWRQELPLDQLLAISQAQLAQDLLREIQRRYNDPTSLTDLAKPLALFMSALEQEEQKIKGYQKTFGWLSCAKLTALAPFSIIRFSKITERLQRLAYFKNIFQSWASEYQLEQTAKKTRAFIAAMHEQPPTCDDYMIAKLRAQMRMLVHHNL